MLEHLRRDDPVEAAVAKRKAQGVTLDDPRFVVGAHLARVDHGPDGVSDLRDLGLLGIERDHTGPEAHRLEGVAATAASEVEQALAPTHPEAPVVDGQHGRSAPTRSRLRRLSSSTNAYCSAVPRAVASHVKRPRTR